MDVIQSTVEIHSQTSRLSVIASNPMVTPISVVGTSSSHIQASPSSGKIKISFVHLIYT